jgi:TolB-like protein/DNA-binding winged helix-turn-helix (wHTH) protein
MRLTVSPIAVDGRHSILRRRFKSPKNDSNCFQFFLTTMSVEQSIQFYEFGPFRLDPSKRLLWREGEPVSLAPKTFETLLALIEKRGQLLEKDALMQMLWPDSFVEESNLTVKISQLRKALGEHPQEHQYIVTVPGRGYRFVADIQTVGGTELEMESREQVASERQTPSKRWLVWPVAAVLFTGLIAIGAALVNSRRNVAPAEPPIRSIAVLPLDNLSGDPAQDYFADGMTESLISNLAQIRALKVISRTSVMRYKGLRKSLPEIARELNVDAVVEGAVQRSAGRVRVSAQLIRASTDTHLWAHEYERDQTDVLKLQSEIAEAIANEIRIQLTAADRARLSTTRTVNPQAHEAYLLGRYHVSKGNKEGWAHAIQYFERAIQITPDYAAAYAGLSDAWLQRGIFELNFKETDTPARTAALKAVELDDQLAEAHISLANIKFNYDWDWAGAEREFARALELDPGSLRVHSEYGYLLMALGRHDEAIRNGLKAIELDPLSSQTQAALGRFFYRARRFTEALPHLQRAVELEPSSIAAHFRLGEDYTQLGKYDEAIAAFGTDTLGTSRVYALTGRKREALELVRQLKEPAISIAAVYVALGDNDEAFRILAKAIEQRNAHLVYLKEDPPLESLHSDPRWATLLRRMNFPST